MEPGRIVTLTPNAALDMWTTTEKFEIGPKLRCSVPKLDPGGGGINVSRVVHRLGGETLAVFAAGGSVGDEVAAALERDGVPALRVGIHGNTRQNFTVREDESGDVLRFVTPGPEVSEAEAETLLEKLRDAVGDASMLVGSGSLPRGVSSRFWAQAAAIAGPSGARFVLDSGDGAEQAMKEGVFLFRENTDTVAKLAGRDLSWPEQAADWASEQVAAGAAEIIIVTEAEKGALLVTAEQRIVLPPPEVESRSAVGAGDSFVGGFCHALAHRKSIEDALRMAVATAAATLLTPGTELCRPEDVERLLDKCGEIRTV